MVYFFNHISYTHHCSGKHSWATSLWWSTFAYTQYFPIGSSKVNNVKLDLSSPVPFPLIPLHGVVVEEHAVTTDVNEDATHHKPFLKPIAGYK